MKKTLLFTLAVVSLLIAFAPVIAEEEPEITFGPEFEVPDETRDNGPNWTCYNVYTKTGQLLGQGCWRNYNNTMSAKYTAYVNSGKAYAHGGNGVYQSSGCASTGTTAQVDVTRNGPKPNSYVQTFTTWNCQ